MFWNSQFCSCTRRKLSLFLKSTRTEIVPHSLVQRRRFSFAFWLVLGPPCLWRHPFHFPLALAWLVLWYFLTKAHLLSDVKPPMVLPTVILPSDGFTTKAWPMRSCKTFSYLRVGARLPTLTICCMLELWFLPTTSLSFFFHYSDSDQSQLW